MSIVYYDVQNGWGADQRAAEAAEEGHWLISVTDAGLL